MPFDESLASRTRDALGRKKGIQEKKMFGGFGFLLNGNLLVAVRKDSLLVRLGPDQGEEALSEPHVTEFQIQGRGTMKGWLVVGLEGVEDDKRLKEWVQRAVTFVDTLPSKP